MGIQPPPQVYRPGHGLQKVGNGRVFGVVPPGKDIRDQLPVHPGDHYRIHSHRRDAAQSVGQTALALCQQSPAGQLLPGLLQRHVVNIGRNAVIAAAALQQSRHQ